MAQNLLLDVLKEGKKNPASRQDVVLSISGFLSFLLVCQQTQPGVGTSDIYQLDFVC